MSWSGTVTCSHCYKQGHNKRKCPSLTREILDNYRRYVGVAKRYEEGGDTVTSEHYARGAEQYRTQYIKRTKIDPATGEKVTNKAAKAERMKNVTCGYCCQRGHTRRTCEAVKLDKMVFVEMSRRDRVAALESAREVGIGVGSLVPMRVYGYHGPKDDQQYGYYLSLRYVEGIDWKAVDSSTPALYAHHIEASKLGASRRARFSGRDQIKKMATAYEEAVAHNQSQPEPLEAPPRSFIPALDPPAGWLTCEPSTIDVDASFPTKGSKYDKQRNYRFSFPNEHMSQVIRDLGLEDKWPDRLRD